MNYYLLDRLNNTKKGGTLKQLIYLAEESRHPKNIYSPTNLHLQIIKNKSTKTMNDLITEFCYEVFGFYIYLEIEDKLVFKIEYIPNEKDDWEAWYGTNKYYTKDESCQLICIENCNGDDSDFEFTEFAFNYFKSILLKYINYRFDNYKSKIIDK